MCKFIKGGRCEKRPFYLKKGEEKGWGVKPTIFFHPGEKLCNMKYICGKYLTITTVLKMHKFCHSGAKPFSKGKDVSKTSYTR